MIWDCTVISQIILQNRKIPHTSYNNLFFFWFKWMIQFKFRSLLTSICSYAAFKKKKNKLENFNLFPLVCTNPAATQAKPQLHYPGIYLSLSVSSNCHYRHIGIIITAQRKKINKSSNLQLESWQLENNCQLPKVSSFQLPANEEDLLH